MATRTCFLAMRSSAILSNSDNSNWVLRIKELSSHGKWQEIISHYRQLRCLDAHPLDVSLFPSFVKAFSYISNRDGKSFHGCLIKQGLESSTSIANSLMSFYIKGGELNSAVSIFDSIRSKDSVSWNILIHGYFHFGALIEGFWHFTSARFSRFEPNISTLVVLLQACQSYRAMREGIKLHGYIIQSGFWANSSVQNSLLRLYADYDMGCARNMFDEMSNRDIISWSVMISGYVLSLEPEIGLQMFRKMLVVGNIEPDGVIVVSVLKACAKAINIHMGKLIHGLSFRRGLDIELFVKNSLIDMYLNSHDIDAAFNVFNEISDRNIVSWNSMLSGLVLHEKYFDALSLIYSMHKEGIETDEVTLVNFLQISKYFASPCHSKAVHCFVIRGGYESNESLINSLIDAYAKCNLIELAWKVFVKVRRRDVVLWSTMIAGFAYCGMANEAISIFQEMSNAKQVPNAITITNLLKACSFLAELKKSKWAHGVAIRRGFAAEVEVGTAIVDMYSKSGDIEASRKAFGQIQGKNIITWSAMIAAYGLHGLANEALALLAEMKQHDLKPNAITTLSVLATCNHSGLIDEGLAVFKSMFQDHGIEPEFKHYSCVVDMLGRAGKLDIAMKLAKIMPEKFWGWGSIWGALLSACRNLGNTKLGEIAVSQVLELEPFKSSGYLLASSMYAREGLWVDAARMRLLAKERGARGVAGYSSVHVNGEASRFVAGDRSHPLAPHICSNLHKLHNCMKIDEIKYTSIFYISSSILFIFFKKIIPRSYAIYNPV